MSTVDWSESDAYRQEYERLREAGEHVARAVAELTHAAQRVGDHASAVPLRESIEGLQLVQAQIATAAERAYSLGQLAARRARHAEFQRQVDQATSSSGSGDAPG